MRKLDRRQRAALYALENAISHEPALRPVVVDDYRPREEPVSHWRYEQPAPGEIDPTGFSEGIV